MTVFGYCRISTQKQNIERQVRNIREKYPDAVIVKEVYTGTETKSRAKFNNLLNNAMPGDTIVFDSVSRMSRDAEEGYFHYEFFYSRDVELIFLKEPHINTEVYKKAKEAAVPMTGTAVDYILEGVNRYLMELAKEQIRIAFDQAEKEVQDLRQRTKEGILTAKLEGKQIGLKKGTKLETKKSVQAKKVILKNNKTFGGSLTNEETWKLAGITKTTFYKYKEELLLEKLQKENAVTGAEE